MINSIVKKLIESNTYDADSKYQEYLYNHIEGIRSAFDNILKPVLISEGISDDMLEIIDHNISQHDKSKYSEDEWAPYRDHFYDPNKNSRSNNIVYNYAWNHHQKHNPHHWNYWVIINDVDEPQIQALEMPFEYVIEMLCDWASAGNHYGNTAYEWYQRQKDKMILHTETRKLVEKYIEYLK